MKRIYTPHLKKYNSRKITLISGPRQAGKTTLSKMIEEDSQYLNFDSSEDRQILREKSWDRAKAQIIFDEIHKMKVWKRWLKGIYDKEGLKPKLCVTGSAKLDTYKKFGDSLAGRYFHYRVHPLDLRELWQLDPSLDTDEVLEKLLLLSGFPEPYLEGELSFYNKWKKTHLNIILRQDLVDQEDVKDIKSMEILVELLQSRVGSPISYSSLARDLQVSDKTIKRWLSILENLYVVFKVTPFHKNIARSNIKKPKYYFYDVARVKGDMGAKIENLVAATLLKHVHFQQDCMGVDQNLYYLAKSSGQEIDFAISTDGEIQTMIEVKTSDDQLSKNFQLFKKDLPHAKAIQLVHKLSTEKTYPSGEEMRKLSGWLARF